MHSNRRLLPEDIVCKITQRNNIRRTNTCDPAVKLLNEKITSDIQKHKQNIWYDHLDAHWDHWHNTHTHWKTIHGLSNNHTYVHAVFAWTKHTWTNLNLQIDNNALPMATHPKVMGHTLDPKLTYNTHIHNISVHAHKPLQIIKALTATGWVNRRRQ